MSDPKQVVVIGAGPAGYVCAIRLAQLGQTVTVVEKTMSHSDLVGVVPVVPKQPVMGAWSSI